MSPLEKLRRKFFKWLQIAPNDQLAIDLILSIIISNIWSGDPIWGYIIGPPGSAKTELLRAFRQRPEIKFISNLRPRSMQSGYRGKEGKDPSLLPTWDGKTVIFKDFTAILSKPKPIRESIIGDLRDAFDGFADLGTGNIGMVHHVSRFSIIAAVTPAIDGYWNLHAQLGERFISLRIKAQDRLKLVSQALSNVKVKMRMRKELSKAVDEFFNTIETPRIGVVKVPSDIKNRLYHLADLIARCRSTVVHTGYSRTLVYLPNPEVGTRLVQQLTKLCIARAVAAQHTTVTHDDYRFAVRVAHDCLPSLTAYVLRILYKAGTTRNNLPVSLPLRKLTKKFSHSTALYQCSDLYSLGVLEKVNKGTGISNWRLKPKIYQAMKRSKLWTV